MAHAPPGLLGPSSVPLRNDGYCECVGRENGCGECKLSANPKWKCGGQLYGKSSLHDNQYMLGWCKGWDTTNDEDAVRPLCKACTWFWSDQWLQIKKDEEAVLVASQNAKSKAKSKPKQPPPPPKAVQVMDSGSTSSGSLVASLTDRVAALEETLRPVPSLVDRVAALEATQLEQRNQLQFLGDLVGRITPPQLVANVQSVAQQLVVGDTAGRTEYTQVQE